MYLKPASVVNRVYLSLCIYGFRFVRLHFHPASAQTAERLSWCLLPQLLLAGGTVPGTLPWRLQRGWARPRRSPELNFTATIRSCPMPADVEIKHACRVDGSQSHTLRDAGQSPAALRMSEAASQAMAHHLLSSHQDSHSVNPPTDLRPHSRRNP